MSTRKITHRREVTVLAAVKAPLVAQALRAGALLDAAPLGPTLSRCSSRLWGMCVRAVARNVPHLSAHAAFARVRLFRSRACFRQVTYLPAVAASASFGSCNRGSRSIALPLLGPAAKIQRLKSCQAWMSMPKCHICIQGIS